jgi:hypothetical protein
MFRLDLDRLRNVMAFDRAEGGGGAPTEARGRVYVTPEGRVVIGDEVGEGESRMLSKVHPAVFAAPRG